jgi:hypothetical protein
MTPSENFVFELSKKSFLPFWSFPNPIGKKGKELCDVLVICDNIIIIISVKDIRVSGSKDINIQYERWVKKAIHDSSDQIHGAERYLQTCDKILLKDKETWINLPPKHERKIFRIAIAFGSPNIFPLPMGDFGKGFVHVFDEQSTLTVFEELDTITDFINYLKAKENFFIGRTIQASTELDFLAFYIQTAFDIDPRTDYIYLDKGLWNSYVESDDYKKWKDEIRVSYFWDNMINHLYNYHIIGKGSTVKREELEEAIRLINLEPRLDRIELGLILENARNSGVKARMLKPLEGKRHTYVFVPLNDKNWKYKEDELKHRCDVARVENPDTKVIIGISIGENSKGESCFDIVYLNMPEITNEYINYVSDIKKELGYFNKPVLSHSKDMRKTAHNTRHIRSGLQQVSKCLPCN